MKNTKLSSLRNISQLMGKETELVTIKAPLNDSLNETITENPDQ